MSQRPARVPLRLFEPSIFIRDFAGLGNRIESLNIAFAIAELGGQSITLDWPELDVLRVAGSRAGKLTWPRRLLRTKPRHFECDDDVKHAARAHTLDLRRFYGRAPLLDAGYGALGARLSIIPALARHIEARFAAFCGDHPVVGVHVRRGDFRGEETDCYQPLSHSHAAVPLWWYVAMMDSIKALQPDVRFFLSLNGKLADFEPFAKRDDCFVMDWASSPHNHAGHDSAVHPVADLFSLACCSVLLATPGSSFSHVAANLLGPPTTALTPAAFARPNQPDFIISRLHHQRLATWNAATRETPPPDQTHTLPLASRAHTDWLHQPCE
ncbi:MAG: hypothetical protein RIR70_442 [Pseudomonadota bacterium]|jgi:hypothetical protein